MACKETPRGNSCPEKLDKSCSPYQLTKTGNNDNCFVDSVVEEALNIGGADLHVFKLLGVHEQGQLIDLTGNGNTISGGDMVNFPATNAFESFVSEWRSLQLGSSIVSSAFIGYDFGEIKLDNGRVKYSVDTSINHNIATLKIQQCANSSHNVSRIRIERSSDNLTWYGVSILDLPDNGDLNTIHFKHSVPSRYWRVRPVTFNGGPTDHWAVQALELMDYDETSIDDIQDDIWLENRHRDYATESVTIKGTYDLLDTQTELSRFGIELPSQQLYIHMSFTQCVERLGRPVVIGDIFEIPSESQYSMTMEEIKKFVEVTDVGWSTEGYTPGWQPTMLRVIAAPMLASQETQDIFGSMFETTDIMDLADNNDGNDPIIQDLSTISQSIQAEAITETPERGSNEGTDIHQFSEEDIQSAKDQGLEGLEKLNLSQKGLYVEDGLPPNGIDFTSGDTMPATPTNGDYHRMTYTGLAGDLPPRLFRYSIAKGRWIYMETDRRSVFNKEKPRLSSYLTSSNKVPPNEIEE